MAHITQVNAASYSTRGLVMMCVCTWYERTRRTMMVSDALWSPSTVRSPPFFLEALLLPPPFRSSMIALACEEARWLASARRRQSSGFFTGLAEANDLPWLSEASWLPSYVRSTMILFCQRPYGRPLSEALWLPSAVRIHKNYIWTPTQWSCSHTTFKLLKIT